jgi:hypothetical protein
MDSKVSSNPKPCHAGLKWTPEENERLMKRVMKNGETIDDEWQEHTTNLASKKI